MRLCEAAGEILRLTIAAVHIPAVTASHVTRHPYERPAEVIVAALGALAGWHISLPVALLAWRRLIYRRRDDAICTVRQCSRIWSIITAEMVDTVNPDNLP